MVRTLSTEDKTPVLSEICPDWGLSVTVAPSYFSQYFQCQIKQAEEKGEDLNIAIKTLYIDRDPVTFRDIALHLQGYHVRPRDSTHFVRLFADAQFYSRETAPSPRINHLFCVLLSLTQSFSAEAYLAALRRAHLHNHR